MEAQDSGLTSRIKGGLIGRSPWIFHMNTGSCAGCDIEITATFTPRYDVERLGVKWVGTPRHADILMMTGAMTRQSAERAKRVYEQMPGPKAVVLVGECGVTSGIYRGAYNILGPADDVVPTDVYVLGCPARPENIVNGLLLAINKLRKGGTSGAE